MEVIYGRISSVGQKDDTQIKRGCKKSFIDIISGTVSFLWKDHKAKKLIAYLEKNPTTKTIVKDISRPWKKHKRCSKHYRIF